MRAATKAAMAAIVGAVTVAAMDAVVTAVSAALPEPPSGVVVMETVRVVDPMAGAAATVTEPPSTKPRCLRFSEVTGIAGFPINEEADDVPRRRLAGRIGSSSGRRALEGGDHFPPERAGNRGLRKHRIEAVKRAVDLDDLAWNASRSQTTSLFEILVVEEVEGADADPGWRKPGEVLAARRYGMLGQRVAGRVAAEVARPTEAV